MSGNDSPNDELGTAYEIFIGALSALSIINVVLVTFLHDQATRNVIYVLDILLSIVFLLDFLMRLSRARSRSRYVFRQFGWADLLGSLPFPQAKILRIFRVIRVTRLLRRYGLKTITRRLTTDRAGSALFSLLFVGVLVLEFGSLAILHAELKDPEANIKTAQDALWYVIETISTVGYGDQYPVTTPGRIIGTFIIIVGVGIFGTLTGYLANVFLTPKKQSAKAETTGKSGEAERSLRQLKELLDRQQTTVSELELMLRGPEQ